MRRSKKYGAGWLPTELVAVGLKIKCCGSQPVCLPEELVARLMRDRAPNAILRFAASLAEMVKEARGGNAEPVEFLDYLIQFKDATAFP